MRVGYTILLDSSHFCYIYTKTTGGKNAPKPNEHYGGALTKDWKARGI